MGYFKKQEKLVSTIRKFRAINLQQRVENPKSRNYLIHVKSEHF